MMEAQLSVAGIVGYPPVKDAYAAIQHVEHGMLLTTIIFGFGDTRIRAG